MSNKRIKVMKASLEKPHFRYVTQAAITFYPENGKYPHHFHRKFVEMCMKFDRKKVQETFKWSNKVHPFRDPYNSNNCSLTFIDGSDWNFDFSKSIWEGFLFSLYWKNEEIEGVRNFQGYDDEPEDEDV